MSKDWVKLSDEELLKLRICDIPVRIEGSWLEELVQRLYTELQSHSIPFLPQAYLADEWFSPEGHLAIAIPFWLAHPRLMSLEKKMMFEVEGGTPEECLKLLRHESGHCFDHAFRFSKRKKWREVFGSPEKDYNPDVYRPRPYSRSFVLHLDNWYAQSHPDEDFAETFAVWLNPDKKWKKDYSGWKGALKKLHFIDELAKECVHRNIRAKEITYLPGHARRMKTTLQNYYEKRKREDSTGYPEFYDEDLRLLFNGNSSLPKRRHAAYRLMKQNRKALVNCVSFWTGEKKYAIDSLVKKLILRCEQLDLRIDQAPEQTILEVATYLTTLVTHYLFTGQFRRGI